MNELETKLLEAYSKPEQVSPLSVSLCNEYSELWKRTSGGKPVSREMYPLFVVFARRIAILEKKYSSNASQADADSPKPKGKPRGGQWTPERREKQRQKMLAILEKNAERREQKKKDKESVSV